MAKTEDIADCKRPYTLGRRAELSESKRTAILLAARKQLESEGFLRMTMDSLAQESGVTRQTIHNLFGSKDSVLEALFNQLALDGGMERMRDVMQQSSPVLMLEGFVRTFCEFWAKDRLLIQRIHGIAAIDPEFGRVIEARNRRRRGAATRIVERLCGRSAGKDQKARLQRVAVVTALTSFEFFDALVDEDSGAEDAFAVVLELVKDALAKPLV